MKYRYVGDHAIVSEQGMPIAPGDYVDLSDEEASGDITKEMIESGQLIEAEEQSKSTKKSSKEAS